MCLKALTRQQYDRDWEVIVVNDGGDQAEIDELIEGLGSNLIIQTIQQENAGPATARNFGVKQARGEYLAFIDDDCIPAPNWIRKLVRHCKKGTMTGGYTQNLLYHNLYSEASQQLVTYLYEAFDETPWHFFTSNNLMLHRDDFMDLGGFDPRFRTAAGEDRAFCLEWIAGGKVMNYVEEAVINHQHHLTFLTFWKQHLKYGQAAKSYQNILRGKQMKMRPSLKFYSRLFMFPLKNSGNFRRKSALIVLLLISQLATCSGYILKSS